ncbi:MAG: DUF2231 domain-containing protein [Opitutales bacterium]
MSVRSGSGARAGLWGMLALLLANPAHAQTDDEASADRAHAALIDAANTAAEAHVRSLVPAVLSIFERSCAECHDPNYRRPRAGFGFVMDLERLRRNDYYVVPGDPAGSFIVEVLLEPPESDLRMPPVDSDVPQLSPAEIRLVQQWVLGGAPTSVEANSEANAATAADNESGIGAVIQPRKKGLGGQLLSVMGRAHPLVVHFPIALLLLAGLAELARQLSTYPRGAAPVVGWCLWIGAPAAVVAALSGWFNVSVQGYGEATVFWHRWTGVGVAAIAVAALGLHLWTRQRPGSPRWLVLVLLVVLTIGILVAGHTGGELVHGEGYFNLF